MLQNLEDFSKFTFTGVNLKGLLPSTQNWATVWQRQFLMQQASEENKSSCYWLHRTFKIYYKQVLKSFNEIPELNSPVQLLTGPFCTLWHHTILTSLAAQRPELNVKLLYGIHHHNSQAVHKRRFICLHILLLWLVSSAPFYRSQTCHSSKPETSVPRCPTWRAKEWFAEVLDARKTQQKERGATQVV